MKQFMTDEQANARLHVLEQEDPMNVELPEGTEWCRGKNSYGFYHTVGACRWEWDANDCLVSLTCEEA